LEGGHWGFCVQALAAGETEACPRENWVSWSSNVPAAHGDIGNNNVQLDDLLSTVSNSAA